MAEERTYTIPLRREFLKAPRYRRSKRSVKTVRNFLKKHMKTDYVKIGKYLNLEIWKHGRKNPPNKIQVKAVKDKEKIKDQEIDVVKVELLNLPERALEEIKVEKEKKEQAKKKKVKKKEEEKKTEEVKEEEEIEEEKEKKKVLEHAKLEKPKVKEAKPEIKDKAIAKQKKIFGEAGKK